MTLPASVASQPHTKLQRFESCSGLRPRHSLHWSSECSGVGANLNPFLVDEVQGNNGKATPSHDPGPICAQCETFVTNRLHLENVLNFITLLMPEVMLIRIMQRALAFATVTTSMGKSTTDDVQRLGVENHPIPHGQKKGGLTHAFHSRGNQPS